MKFLRVNEFDFVRPDSNIVTIEVPKNLNQQLLKTVKLDEYGVFLVATGREIAESEICKLTRNSASNIVGYLIPGAAIVSEENAENSDAFFGTYSLIAANAVSTQSKSGIYALANAEHKTALTKDGIFAQNIFYAVVWLKKLGVTKNEFFKKYFVSLASAGLFPSPNAIPSNKSEKTQIKYESPISLTPNQEWPEYIQSISTELAPYASDPFLRFFYTYQVIEALMSKDYSSKFNEIKSRFTSHQDTSITHLKDFIDEFQNITKEKPRIRSALQPACSQTNMLCEQLLGSLGEDYSRLDFAERIYRIRNIIFHDFQRVKSMGALVSDLEDKLSSYLLASKLR